MGRISLFLGKVVAQEMQLRYCEYCMKETWNTTIGSVCYVDYEKAFDHVDWTKLMTILQNI